MGSEESETYERDQIENLQSIKRINHQQSRKLFDIVDTCIEFKTDNKVEDTNEIIELQLNIEGLEMWMFIILKTLN